MKGLDVVRMFAEEGGEGDVRMSFLHSETVLYNWGRGKFVKKLYKKEPSLIVKFFWSPGGKFV